MSRKNNYLQWLRGIATCMVFLSHFIAICFESISIGGYDLNCSPFRLLWGGYAAVVIFFVMTGFFMQTPKPIGGIADYLKAVLRRVVRLYPAFALTTIIGIILCRRMSVPEDVTLTTYARSFWQEKQPFSTYLRQFLLLGGLDPDLVNPPMWTLMHEARFAFVAPMFLLLVHRNSHILNVGLLSGLVMVSFLHPYGYFVFAFVLGIEIRHYLPTLQRYLGSTQAKWRRDILLALSIFLLDISYLANSLHLDVCTNVLFILTSLGAGAVIVYASMLARPMTLVERGLVVVGNYSYALYLLHHIFLLASRGLIRYGVLAYGAWVIVISAAGATVMTKLDKVLQGQLRKRLHWLYQAEEASIYKGTLGKGVKT